MGSPATSLSATQIDEVSPIVDYITAEMNRNAYSDVARRIRENNSFSATTCIEDWSRLPWWRQLLGAGTPDQCIDRQFSARTAALLAWAWQVRQDGPWDHKPIIRMRFRPRRAAGFQTWHRLGNFEYYYDIWSNVHYGYVGAACGFSDSVLLDGAGLEQIGSTALRGRLPTRSPGVSGLRGFDDASDRASIRIGIQLFRRFPVGVMAAQVLSAVVASSEVTKRYVGPAQ